MFRLSSLWSPLRRRHSWPSIPLVRVGSASYETPADAYATPTSRRGRLRRAFSVGNAVEQPPLPRVQRAQSWPRTHADVQNQMPSAPPRWGHAGDFTVLRLRILVRTGASVASIVGELHRYARTLGSAPADVAKALLTLDRQLQDDASLLRPGTRLGQAFAFLVRELQTSDDQSVAAIDKVFNMVARRVTHEESVAPTRFYLQAAPRMTAPPAVLV